MKSAVAPTQSEQELARYYSSELNYLDGPLFETKPRKGIVGTTTLLLKIGLDMFLLGLCFCAVSISHLYHTFLKWARPGGKPLQRSKPQPSLRRRKIVWRH
jgi:hypothetical protein